MLPIRALTLILIFSIHPQLFSSDYSYDRLELVASQGEAMDHFRISAFLDRETPIFRTKRGEFFGSLAANYAVWKGVSNAGDILDITDIGLTPMITFFPAKVWWRSVRFFIEAGIGAHLLSDTELATKNWVFLNLGEAVHDRDFGIDYASLIICILLKNRRLQAR